MLWQIETTFPFCFYLQYDKRILGFMGGRRLELPTVLVVGLLGATWLNDPVPQLLA